MDQWLNKIHNGDCIKVMRSLPSESVGLVVVWLEGKAGHVLLEAISLCEDENG